MSISGSHDAYRVNGDSQSLAVASTGGTAVATTAFDTQTRLVQLMANGVPASSTGGVRFKFISSVDSTVSSTLGAFLPFNWPEVWKINPGELVAAISNNTGSCTLVVTPLTD